MKTKAEKSILKLSYSLLNIGCCVYRRIVPNAIELKVAPLADQLVALTFEVCELLDTL